MSSSRRPSSCVKCSILFIWVLKPNKNTLDICLHCSIADNMRLFFKSNLASETPACYMQTVNLVEGGAPEETMRPVTMTTKLSGNKDDNREQFGIEDFDGSE